jgi:hypothetical protein
VSRRRHAHPRCAELCSADHSTAVDRHLRSGNRLGVDRSCCRAGDANGAKACCGKVMKSAGRFSVLRRIRLLKPSRTSHSTPNAQPDIWPRMSVDRRRVIARTRLGTPRLRVATPQHHTVRFPTFLTVETVSHLQPWALAPHDRSVESRQRGTRSERWSR